jgi:hypothetical protein
VSIFVGVVVGEILRCLGRGWEDGGWEEGGERREVYEEWGK